MPAEFYLIIASLSIGMICAIISYYACIFLITHAHNLSLMDFINPIAIPFFSFGACSIITAILMIHSA